MYTINNNIIDELIIKNSKFICLLYRIDEIKEINTYLTKAKELYKDATHYCYAYILDNLKKASDDGEPSSTAGTPMLQVLEKTNLDHTLAIVIRYFGGIKLGAGGLVRAYTKSVSNAIKLTTLKDLIKGHLITITFPYDLLKKIDYLLKDIPIISKQYNDTITYTLKVSEQKLKELTNHNLNINIIENIYL